ncbi:MAG: hypothetical protein ACXVHT_01265 [Methanobacterium sp.]
MKSFVNKWQENKSFIQEPNASIMMTLISKDDQNGNKLYLAVGFNHRNTYDEYTYSFILVNKDNRALTNYMTVRAEVAKYLPKELIGTRQIFPIIKELTRELLKHMTPEEIHRKAVESNISLDRYDEITKIFVNEFDYEDVTDEQLKSENIWILRKKDHNYKNSALNEIYILNEKEYWDRFHERISESWMKSMKNKFHLLKG